MSLTAFFGDDARKRTAEAIGRAEAKTSAELVVAVRRASGPYRDPDYLWGLGFGLGVLTLLLWLPQTFTLWTFPFDVALGFALGTALSAWVPPMRRLLLTRRRLDRQAAQAAQAAFHALGISRTTGRTGILVFLSAFERRAVLVPDAGVVPGEVKGWAEAVGRLDRAFRGGDVDGFVAALADFGGVLAPALPHADDDVNELPDTVDAS